VDCRGVGFQTLVGRLRTRKFREDSKKQDWNLYENVKPKMEL
jgi:hypothetical protein